jgi:hypothetical protein
VALVTVVVHGAGGVDPNAQPFVSTLQVSNVVALVHATPACAHVASIKQMHCGPTPSSVPHVWCAAHAAMKHPCVGSPLRGQ